jgi:hypothetical protein
MERREKTKVLILQSLNLSEQPLGKTRKFHPFLFGLPPALLLLGLAELGEDHPAVGTLRPAAAACLQARARRTSDRCCACRLLRPLQQRFARVNLAAIDRRLGARFVVDCSRREVGGSESQPSHAVEGDPHFAALHVLAMASRWQ